MKLRHLLFLTAALFTTPAAAAVTAKEYSANQAYDVTATVTVAGTTTPAVDLHGTTLVGIFIPPEFDGSAITLMASDTLTGTYVAVQDGAGATLSISTTASRYVPLTNLALVSGLRFIKLVAGTSQTTTDTVFILALRPV